MSEGDTCSGGDDGSLVSSCSMARSYRSASAELVSIENVGFDGCEVEFVMGIISCG